MYSNVGTKFLSEVQISVRMPEELRVEIERVRHVHGASMKEVVNTGLRLWLEKYDAEDNEKDRA